MEQRTGGKWLIHGTKHRKDNQLQSLELPWNILVENLNMTQMSPKVTCSIQYSKGMSKSGNNIDLDLDHDMASLSHKGLMYKMGCTMCRKVLHDYIRNVYIFSIDLGPVSLKESLIRDRVRVLSHSGAKCCNTWHTCTLLGFASCRKVIAENQGHRHQQMSWWQFIKSHREYNEWTHIAKWSFGTW